MARITPVTYPVHPSIQQIKVQTRIARITPVSHPANPKILKIMVQTGSK
jgi:hypothetical protein